MGGWKWGYVTPFVVKIGGEEKGSTGGQERSDKLNT